MCQGNVNISRLYTTGGRGESIFRPIELIVDFLSFRPFECLCSKCLRVVRYRCPSIYLGQTTVVRPLIHMYKRFGLLKKKNTTYVQCAALVTER